MSLSSQMDTHVSGRVLLGATTPGPDSMTLQEMEGKKKLVWDDAMNGEFMERVRGKAQTKAKEIIAEAMEEARHIKQTAHNAGLSQGLAAGQEQLEQHLENISVGLGQVIQSIQDQADVIWEERRHDFVRLITMAVEKIVGIEMVQRRKEMLDFLLEQAVTRIESDRFFIIRTSPTDADIIDELLVRVQTQHPKLAKWMIKSDPSITAGVIIESADAKVENTVEGRWAGVAAILDQLTVYGPNQE